MLPEPLHPAIVHFPIVLAALLPLTAIAALIIIRRGEPARRTWAPVVLLAVALAGTSWIAVRTGEAEEDVVEEFVPEAVIHEHEEAAELFLPLAVGTLVLVAAGLMDGRLGRVTRSAAALATLLLLAAGYRVGHTGGDLVYQHGAAAAYADAGAVPTALQDAADDRTREEETEDEEEHSE